MKLGPYTIGNKKGVQQRTIDAAQGIVPKDAPALAALAGNGDEYLICTDTDVFVIKKGALQGQFAGKGFMQIPYSTITSVNIDKDILTYTLNIVAPGMVRFDRNTRADYGNLFDYEPNTFVVGKGEYDALEETSKLIMEMVNKFHQPAKSGASSSPKSVADELIKLKGLFEEGYITWDEFLEQKRKLLGE